MPYFISNSAEGCSGWATVKADGEVLGCHATKQDAIDQALAIAQAEGSTFEGELRNESGPPAIIVDIDGTLIIGGRPNEKLLAYLDSFDDTEIMIVTARVESERASTLDQLDSLGIDFDRLYMKPNASDDSTDYKRETARMLLETFNVMLAIDNDAANRRAFQGLGITALDVSDVPETVSDDEVRQVNLTPPAYMRAAARQGLKYHAEGLSGEGLVDRTVREARAMAQGNVTADKWVRIAAWIARHLVDLDSPDADPSSDNYPSAGVVAHLLWGSGPSKRAAERALAYARGVVDRLEAENAERMTGNTVAEVETRSNPTQFEIRETSEGMTFEGYAAMFDSPSQPLPFVERIAPGAFNRSLKSRNDIKLLWNHSTGEVLGSTRAGTLKLTEDDRGLRVWAMLPNTTTGRDAAELIRRGDVDSMSFGFSVPKNGDSWSENGSERTLNEVRLHEVSIVAFPAYTATSGTTTVRGLDRLAQRTEVDADALADALLKVEMGDNITEDDRKLLERVLEKLAPETPEEAESDSGLEMLQLKKKKLELLMGL